LGLQFLATADICRLPASVATFSNRQVPACKQQEPADTVPGMQHIAAKIEALRSARGLSKDQVASLSGFSRMTFRRRLAAPEDFTAGELARVAAVFGTTASDLAWDAS
jgi:hypothetical protein